MSGSIKFKKGEDYYIKALLKETKISDIMSQKPKSINVDALFSEVPKNFNEHGIRHLPVVDGENKLVGLITQRDLYKVHSPRKLMDGSWYYDIEALNKIILKHVMIKKPFMMGPDSCIGDALLKIVYNKYGCIPIVDKKKLLLGIITQIDILKFAARFYPEKK